MTKLSSIREQLRSLQSRRRRTRYLTAWSATILAVLWALLAFYAIDWMFELTRAQRIVLLCVGAGAIGWVFVRKTMPWLSSDETELDVALLVEHRQKIDSDLVAAIQFESPEANKWGSRQLEDAVIDYVAEFGKGWNLLDGFTRENLARRLTMVGATVGVFALLALLFPVHMQTFGNRLFLGNWHYPTDTMIEHVAVNDKALPIEPGGPAHGGNFPYGRPLKFKVLCSGDLPETGMAKLRASSNNMTTEIELTKVEESSDVPVPEGKAFYEGELPRMVDTLTCSLEFGDAWTDPKRLRVLPLPVVEATLVGTRPDYARSGAAGEIRSTARQLKVLEGSKIDFEVVCKNAKQQAGKANEDTDLQKELVSVSLVIERPEDLELDDSVERNDKGQPVFRLTKTQGDLDDKERQIWRLSGEGTPLAQIRGEGIGYRLLVEDNHEMSPERPIEGSIVAVPDMQPTASAKILANYWLPSASPKLNFRVSDDYGIDSATIDVVITREAAGQEETKQITLLESGDPILADSLPAEVEHNLQLSQFGLKKGDEVAITLNVVDYRGSEGGRNGSSNTLKLFIADQSQILAGVTKVDQGLLEKFDLMKKVIRTDGSKK